MNEIPVTKLNDKFYFDEGQSNEFNINVLSISPHYLLNSPTFNLTLKTPLGTVPSWIQTTFSLDKLIFWGKIPE